MISKSYCGIIPNLMFKQSFINDFKELLWEDINVNRNLKGKFDNSYEKVHTAVIQNAPLEKVNQKQLKL